MPENLATRSYSTLDEILEAIRIAAREQPDSMLFVGIDGAGGSGKSTLALRLSEALDESIVVHIDDFADWTDGANWQLSTFAERVLEPLKAGITAKYQRYDWPTDSLGDWFEIAPGKIAIVEGVTAVRADLREYWAVSVFVDCPRDVRLERGVTRDGEEIRSKWTDIWMPGEDAYFDRDRPREHAQFLFDGNSESDESGESDSANPG
jgi:uridine kinase